MKSLADVLSVADVEKPPQQRTEPAPFVEPKTPREFAKTIVESQQYRESLLRRILVDELAPAVEVWLLNTAHGKPVDRVEVRDQTNPLAGISATALEERAMFLANIAREMRVNAAPAAETDPGVAVH